MYSLNAVDYFENFDKTIKLSEFESILFKRLNDNTVLISYNDILTGTNTKLAFYISGKWTGYNPVNFNKLFFLFKKHKSLKPNLIRFLTPNDHVLEINKIEKVITCFRKRFQITILKTKRNLHTIEDIFEKMNH